ncbi:MAG: hypothetical protein LW601_04850 [Cryomorphaceae bacterium]|jgi:hypothetical protein|nr:hypothetical protein [Cryomorphaceae bacterium]
MDVFLDTFRFVFPSLLILIAVYLMMSSYFDNEDRRRRAELRAQNQRQALPLRLQAYERLALFLERISPNSLVVRVKSGSLSNAEYLLLLQKSIRDEYEHNLSQQIYVSDEVWDYVTTAKSATVSLLNTVSAQLDPEASGAELSKALLGAAMELKQLPTQAALKHLKAEVAYEF